MSLDANTTTIPSHVPLELVKPHDFSHWYRLFETKRFQRSEFDPLAVGRSLLIDPKWALKASPEARNEY